MTRANRVQPLCGCWLPMRNPNAEHHIQRSYLPLTKLEAHTVILSTTSRTTLTQTFVNTSDTPREEILYSFPLYNGVSIVSFTANIGDVKITGVVKEKGKARQEYQAAVDRGERAGLLEQLPEAADVFTTKLGNVSPAQDVVVEIVYINELKHDSEADGIRFSIPSNVAPRYGLTPNNFVAAQPLAGSSRGINITVDVECNEGSHIQQVQSPTHPVSVTIGRTSQMRKDAFNPHHASANISFDDTSLDKDFVVIINAKDVDIPTALLETHPSIPSQRALMATLVPRFKIPPSYGEIVFMVDRSSSMSGMKMKTVIKALAVMLKSLPVGIKFNICSFGNNYSLMWPRSKSYDQSTLEEALKNVEAFDANMGGTEMLAGARAIVENRYTDTTLDVILLTDGQIWNQESLFSFINESSKDRSCRFFSLGIGRDASTALVEGISAAGDGYSQFVIDYEKFDKKMVRLLKGALTPHVKDYSLEIKYAKNETDGDDFEMVEYVDGVANIDAKLPSKGTPSQKENAEPKKTTSLFDPNVNPDENEKDDDTPLAERQAQLCEIQPPSILQAPSRMPSLYPFNRTTVYLLLGPETHQRTPESIVLRGSTSHGPLELEIKIQDVGQGQTIHQLAARKAVHELEQGRGWVAASKDKIPPSLWDDVVEREAVRLGVQYQVGGKWTSFVAVEGGKERAPVEFGGQIPEEPAQPHRGFTDRLRLGGSRSAGGGSALMMRQHQFQENGAMLDRGGGGANPPPPPAAPENPFEALGRPVNRSSKLLHKKKANMSWRADTRSGPSREGLSDRGDAGRAKVDDDDITTKTATTNSWTPPSTTEERMYALIALQNFDGSWDWSEKLAAILGKEASATAAAALGSKEPGSLEATASAIAFFRVRAADEEDTWELIVEKAKWWMAGQDGIDDVEKTIAGVEEAIKAA